MQVRFTEIRLNSKKIGQNRKHVLSENRLFLFACVVLTRLDDRAPTIEAFDWSSLSGDPETNFYRVKRSRLGQMIM